MRDMRSLTTESLNPSKCFSASSALSSMLSSGSCGITSEDENEIKYIIMCLKVPEATAAAMPETAPVVLIVLLRIIFLLFNCSPFNLNWS